MCRKTLYGVLYADMEVENLQLTTSLLLTKYIREKWNIIGQYINNFIFERHNEILDLVERDFFNNILIVFGIHS
jgi:Leucine-rich repeat (LRR) protein